MLHISIKWSRGVSIHPGAKDPGILSTGVVNINNKKQLIDLVLKHSRELKVSTINRIINSMNKRIDELFNVSFDSIKY